jgi:amidase
VDDNVWITRFGAGDSAAGGTGVRIAVKDNIDVAGVVTTCACPAHAEGRAAAEADAGCLSGARAAGAFVVGKTNLHELAYGTSGINPFFGTPTNPLDGRRIPGGSSSGSAVAVATGQADVALGTDTGGSVRIPAACCGVVGLKTTHGRIPLAGVWPLATSLDTVGPLARDVDGALLGMQLLEPGFVEAELDERLVVGRLRPESEAAVDAAVDAALVAAGFEVREMSLPSFSAAREAGGTLLGYESWLVNGHLVGKEGISVAERIAGGADVSIDDLATVGDTAVRWLAELDEAFETVDLLALPTLPILPPYVAEGLDTEPLGRHTMPVNLAGLPAIALPAPTGGVLPASLQLVAPAYAEDLLIAAARLVERAVADRS